MTKQGWIKLKILDAAEQVVLFFQEACGLLMWSLGGYLVPAVPGHHVGDPWCECF